MPTPLQRGEATLVASISMSLVSLTYPFPLPSVQTRNFDPIPFLGSESTIQTARNATIRAELHRRASHSAEEAHRVAEILAASSTGTAPISVGLIAKHAEGSGGKSTP